MDNQEVGDEIVAEKEFENNSSEAGGVAWCDIWGTKADNDGEPRVVKISLTSRAANPKMALDALLDALTYAKDLNLHPFQPMAKSAKVETFAAPTTQAAAPTVQAAAPMAAAAQNLAEGGQIKATKMVVAPRTDGKTKLDFYETGRKYPEIAAVMAPEQLANMMQATGDAWEASHFTAIAEYDCNYIINWRPSKALNQNGKPYKNIVSVAKL